MAKLFNKESGFRFLLKNNITRLGSIMALTLSIISLIIAIKANSISESQKNLTEASLQPSFRITKDFGDWDSLALRFQSYYLSIYNVEGHCDNLKSDVVIELSVNYEMEKNKWGNVKIYIVGPLIMSQIGNLKEGIMEIRGNRGNLIEENIFEEKVASIISKLGYSYFLSTRLIVRLKYIDKSNNQHEKYYDTSIKQGELISDEEGQIIFQDYQKKESEAFLFRSMHLDEETKKLKQYILDKIEEQKKE